MAIVTTGLQLYFNPKDGIKSGNKLNNLAPAGIAGRQTTVVGGTLLGNGAIQMDGIDDETFVMATESMFTVAGSPYTLEYAFTPRQFSGDADILDGGAYFGTFSWGNMYFEFVNTSGSIANQTNNTAIKSANVLYLQVTYSGSTVKVYINGTLVGTLGTTTHALSMGGYTKLAASPVGFGSPFKADYHLLRVYNRELTTAELTTNRGETTNIGLPITKIQTGILKFHPGVSIPVFDITGNESEKLRFQTTEGKCFIELVPTTDPNASKIRCKTAAGIMAFKK